MLGQGLSETADAASEIERTAFTQAGMKRGHLFERSLDLPNPRFEELPSVPAATLAIGVSKNRPQWIAGREQVPVFPQSFQIQIQLWNSGVRMRRHRTSRVATCAGSRPSSIAKPPDGRITAGSGKLRHPPTHGSWVLDIRNY